MKLIIENLNKSKVPVIKTDKALNQYKDKILFEKKVDEANRVLKTVGLPKLQEQK